MWCKVKKTSFRRPMPWESRVKLPIPMKHKLIIVLDVYIIWQEVKSSSLMNGCIFHFGNHYYLSSFNLELNYYRKHKNKNLKKKQANFLGIILFVGQHSLCFFYLVIFYCISYRIWNDRKMDMESGMNKDKEPINWDTP